MNPEFTVKIGRKTYPIVFKIYGLTKLERETGLSLVDLASAVNFGIDPKQYRKASTEEQNRINLGALQKLSPYKLQALLYAGLEGGRWQCNRSDPPFDFDEVADLVEEAGGYAALFEPLVLGFASQLPKLLGTESEDAEPKNPPKTRKRSTGKTSSKPRSKRV
jgi:hypothetical protein